MAKRCLSFTTSFVLVFMLVCGPLMDGANAAMTAHEGRVTAMTQMDDCHGEMSKDTSDANGEMPSMSAMENTDGPATPTAKGMPMVSACCSLVCQGFALSVSLTPDQPVVGAMHMAFYLPSVLSKNSVQLFRPPIA